MSHDLSLTRIHTSLDGALESWWALLGAGFNNCSGQEKLILLKQMYQQILDQHAMARGAADYEWSLAIMGSWVTWDMWPLELSDGMLMRGPRVNTAERPAPGGSYFPHFCIPRSQLITAWNDWWSVACQAPEQLTSDVPVTMWPPPGQPPPTPSPALIRRVDILIHL